MYCSECGTRNEDHANYCVNDGSPLRLDEFSGTLTVAQQLHCRHCGAENYQGSLYCMACGKSFDTYRKSIRASGSASRFDLHLLKSIVPGLLLALGMLGLFSQLIAKSSVFTRQVGMWIPYPGLENLKLTDIALLSNLVSFTSVRGNNEFSHTAEYASSGFTALLIIAVFSLLTGGFLVRILNREMTEWKAALVFGVSYALLLGLLTLVAGMSQTPERMNGENVTFHFNTIPALVNGLFIGTVCSFAGMGLAGLVHQSRNISPGWQRPVYLGIYAVAAGYAVVLLLNLWIFSGFETVPTDRIHLEGTFGKIVFITKTALFLLNLVMFNSFFLRVPGENSPEVNYSFLHDTPLAMLNEIDFFIPVGYFDSHEWITIMITGALFICIGRLLEGNSNRIMPTILLYSLAFAGIMSFLTYYSAVNYQMTGNQFAVEVQQVFAGFGMLRTFALAFLYGGVTALLGMLTKKIF